MTNKRNTLAVISQSGETLTLFDAYTGVQTGCVTGLRPEPHELCYDARCQRLYITHAYRHGWFASHGENGIEISVFDCTSRKVIDIIDIGPYKGPHYTVLDAQLDILYSSVEGALDGAGGISGIDIKSHQVVKAVALEHTSHWFVMTPDGSKAFTCSKEAGFIFLDLKVDKMIGKIQVPGGCEQLGISNDGKLAYFPTPGVSAVMRDQSQDKAILVIDTVMNKVVRSIPLEYGGLTVHVGSQDRLLVGQYILQEDNHSIQSPNLWKA